MAESKTNQLQLKAIFGFVKKWVKLTSKKDGSAARNEGGDSRAKNEEN